MLPVQQAERAHLLTGIQIDLLAVDHDNRNVIIQLISGKIRPGQKWRGCDSQPAWHKPAILRRGQAPHTAAQVRRTCRSSASTHPRRPSISFNFSFLRSASDFVARKAGVLQLHHRLIELARLLLLGVSGSNNPARRLFQGLRRTGKPFRLLWPSTFLRSSRTPARLV